MSLEPVGRVSVDLAGMPVVAQILKAQVGRISLFLLDTNVEENSDESRAITDNLYGGGEEHRLRQEILLGIGGVRALEAVGRTPQVFHINEGHAGFLALERLRVLIRRDGLTFPEAIEAVRAGAVFTTHTPVSAGIDRFPRSLIERYFPGWAEECGVAFSDLMELGLEPGGSGELFNMAVLSFRLSGYCNGVARLHGQTSKHLFQHLWPDISFDEIPIHSVTNGIHAATWVSSEMVTTLDRYVLPEWWDAGPERWVRLDDASDEDIWRVREQCRERLVGFVRKRLKVSRMLQGVSEGDLAWCDDVFDPGVLTIGFARRFAAYKRPTLLLSQPERLKALLNNPEQPVQILFAGKAHPADEPGKAMIREIFTFAQDPEVRRRMAFLENYDMSLAKLLCQGVDLWLNTPGPKVSATRMLREYVEWAYDPAAARTEALAANGYQRAKALAAWKATVQKQWSDVAIEAAGEDDLVPELGTTQQVLAQVRLGALTPDDVAVQLVHGPVGQGDYLIAEQIEPMEVSGKASDGTTWCYKGSFS